MNSYETADHQAILTQVRIEDDEYVKVAIVDIDGVLRGKYLDRRKFLGAVEGGFGFCDVVFGWDSSDECYDNVTYTGWKTGYPDGSVRIDLATHRRIPWEHDRHFFLCDYVGSSPDVVVCPRRLLQRVIDKATSMGFAGAFGLEYEFFNFRETPGSLHEKGFRGMEPLTPGMFGYSVLRQAHNQPYFEALLTELRRFGVPLEGLHTETGPGVFEAAILYSGALEAADRAQLFKAGVKEIGHRFGIMPTFMARWNTSLPGCSGHTHQSLWDLGGERNLFYDESDPNRMSDLFRYYLAGILTLLPDLLALVAPTVNSYKRLVDGFWAPTKPTWGIDNRTVACRVIPGSAASTRLEFRVPGSDSNPYLAVAVSLAAGLYGIEHQLELQAMTVGSGYLDDSVERLPRNLQEATARLAASKPAREILGEDFVDHFVATREWEWRKFQDAVTDWELRRYFEII
ncbi:MAG: glutamine synthetase family protein [Acidimicrobiales bacterium]|nr:glutamine synthetase family protein [Acidimicrobiales bacterium]